MVSTNLLLKLDLQSDKNLEGKEWAKTLPWLACVHVMKKPQKLAGEFLALLTAREAEEASG